MALTYKIDLEEAGADKWHVLVVGPGGVKITVARNLPLATAHTRREQVKSGYMAAGHRVEIEGVVDDPANPPTPPLSDMASSAEGSTIN